MKCRVCKHRPPRDGSKTCQPCLDRESVKRVRFRLRRAGIEPTEEQIAEYLVDSSLSYVPLDEWLSDLRVRILRAIRWFDWTEADDIAAVLSIPANSHNASARSTFHKAMQRLTESGKLLRRTTQTLEGGPIYEYRLAPGVVVTPPQDLSVCSDEEAAA